MLERSRAAGGHRDGRAHRSGDRRRGRRNFTRARSKPDTRAWSRSRSQSKYTPGARGRGWLKIKTARTLDLVIVAADWGYGRRNGWLSNYHLAARDEPRGGFAEVGKTFKGLTDDEFAR